MYTLDIARKKKPCRKAHYTFKKFQEFYAVADALTYTFTGRFKVNVMCDSPKEIQEFISKAGQYDHLDIFIYASEGTVNYILMFNTSAPLAENRKMYDVFRELVAEHKLLFDEQSMKSLYASIEHDTAAIEEALMLLEAEYGHETLINEKKLSAIILINKIVYPRTVLVDYLLLGRWRASRLRHCIEDVGNDVALWAMIKNIKTLYDNKVRYLRTGEGNWLTKEVSTRNLNLMYRVLYLEREGIKDIQLLLDLYERGLSCKDLKIYTKKGDFHYDVV